MLDKYEWWTLFFALTLLLTLFSLDLLFKFNLL